jgi:asparagine synthase (glutamine-hydrolysing)
VLGYILAVLLPSYILAVLGDRMEMAHSVEGRVPFLDHHVVELARDLSVAQKIRGMTEKYVLREAARPVLSATVHRRQKHPFRAPPAARAPGERLYELVQDTLRGPVMACPSTTGQKSSRCWTACPRWETPPAPPSTPS